MVMDIKISFVDSDSETWLNYWASEIPKIDWNNAGDGRINFKTFLAYKVGDKSKTPVCQMAYYKTKTQKVIYISATKKI
jgi:hypothetical protein